MRHFKQPRLFSPTNWCRNLAFLFLCFLGLSGPSFAKPYFQDGFLGLTQDELREQLGTPMAVRSRKAALRVFSYYTFPDWQKYLKN